MLHPLQPRAKAQATSHSTTLPSSPPSRASTRPSASAASAPSHRAPAPPKPAADVLSPRATTLLIRRALAPHTSALAPLADVLPPLTSSPATDTQLYALLAIILRDYISTWYARITPDTSFLDALLELIAHATHALEARARAVDWLNLLLARLPAHLDAWAAAVRLSTAAHPAAPRPAFAALRPHPALSGPDAEAAYRSLLAQALLAALLPPGDAQNPALSALASDLLADMLLGGLVAARVAEPMFVWDLLRSAAEAARRQRAGTVWAVDERAAAPTPPPTRKRRLDAYGLVEAAADGDAGTDRPRARIRRVVATAQQLLAPLLAAALVVVTFVRHVAQLWSLAAKLSPREPPTTGPRHGVLELPVWRTLAALLCLEQRMPWAAGLAALAGHAAVQSGVGAWDGRLDRYVLLSLLSVSFVRPFRCTGARHRSRTTPSARPWRTMMHGTPCVCVPRNLHALSIMPPHPIPKRDTLVRLRYRCPVRTSRREARTLHAAQRTALSRRLGRSPGDAGDYGCIEAAVATPNIRYRRRRVTIPRPSARIKASSRGDGDSESLAHRPAEQTKSASGPRQWVPDEDRARCQQQHAA